MTDNNSVEPGQPDWWMQRLVQRLLHRQSRYDYLEAYHTGNHPMPDGDKRYVKALASFQRMSRTNIIGMINKTPPERMRLLHFRIGKTDSPSDELATRIWSANNMDYQAPIVHQTASALGDDYVMVSPPINGGPLDTGMPIFTAEDPRVCITESDPGNPQISRAALRMWQDDVLQRVVAVLYLPSRTYQYFGPAISDICDMDVPNLTKKLLSGAAGGGLQLVDDFANPIGIVPIVRAAWQPTFKEVSFSESEDVLDIQDRVNHTILERMVITRSQAYKQRWAKGMKIPQDKNGQKKPPFDPGADMIWIAEGDNAAFGEFQEVDIRQILEAVKDDINNMAVVTKTPPHYLMGTIANVSGSTLTQAEAGLTSKTKQRMIAMGWAWERVMRIAFLYLNETEKAKEVDFEVVWADPELHSRVELADAFAKEVQGGLPLPIASQRLGLDADQVEMVIQFQKEQEAKEQKLADDAQQNALALQAAKGPISAGPK